MFEFHQFDIAGNNVEPQKVSLPNDLIQLATRVVIADGAVESSVLFDVKLWLIAVQRGERGLRIEIDCEHSIALQCEMLSEMRGGGGLTRSSLKINDANDLQLFARDAMRSVSAHALAGFVEISTKALDVLECVRSSTRWTGVRLRAPTLQRQLAEVTVIDTDEFSDFARCEPAKMLACFWREQLRSVGVKFRG